MINIIKVEQNVGLHYADIHFTNCYIKYALGY